MKEMINMIKRHEKNKGDELTPEGMQDAMIFGGMFALDYEKNTKVFFFHSPKNRAKQTVEYFVKGFISDLPDASYLSSSKIEGREDEFGITKTFIKEDVLLDTQGFSEEYRNAITPLAGRDKWKTEGLLYVLQNDPGNFGGESNASCAARISKHLIDTGYVLTKLPKAHAISVTHGPLPEHFLSHLLFEDIKEVEPQKIIDAIGGGFDNGNTFDLIRYEKGRGLNVQIEREGKILYQNNDLSDLARVANLK